MGTVRLAARHDFVICSKDDDFRWLVASRGYRPRLIHLALGNSSNDAVLASLLAAADHRQSAFTDASLGIVVIE